MRSPMEFHDTFSVVIIGFPMRSFVSSILVTSKGVNCVFGVINGRVARLVAAVILAGNVISVGSGILTPVPLA